MQAREGSLEAPERHPIPWQDAQWYDEAALDDELRRVFDICHGCRRCFNLCDSFPRLFDLIDESESGELDTVASPDFGGVVEACTMCDMCFMTKCPYVPPHEFDLDFPHLMLRYRAAHPPKAKGLARQLTKTDRNGKLGVMFSGITNWGMRSPQARKLLSVVADVDPAAALPPYAKRKLTAQAETLNQLPSPNDKVVIYATCFGEHNNPEIGKALEHVLKLANVEFETIYPECCGMPQWEGAEVATVADKAIRVAAAFAPHIAAGKKVIALVPSCALMLKTEWPGLHPNDPAVRALADSTFDLAEYVVHAAGWLSPAAELDYTVGLHIPCHARAQNIGAKAVTMLKLIPDIDIEMIERCSGHGGSWGVMNDNFQVAMKYAKPVVRKLQRASLIVSECPLGGLHLAQALHAALEAGAPVPQLATHPVLVLAKAYGFPVEFPSIDSVA